MDDRVRWLVAGKSGGLLRTTEKKITAVTLALVFEFLFSSSTDLLAHLELALKLFLVSSRRLLLLHSFRVLLMHTYRALRQTVLLIHRGRSIMISLGLSSTAKLMTRFGCLYQLGRLRSVVSFARLDCLLIGTLYSPFQSKQFHLTLLLLDEDCRCAIRIAFPDGW